MTSHSDLITAFLTDRNNILRSMDVDRMIAFTEKYNPGYKTPSREVAEIGMHKARTACLFLTKEERQLSKDWLDARGYKSMDDGDLT